MDEENKQLIAKLLQQDEEAALYGRLDFDEEDEEDFAPRKKVGKGKKRAAAADADDAFEPKPAGTPAPAAGRKAAKR